MKKCVERMNAELVEGAWQAQRMLLAITLSSTDI